MSILTLIVILILIGVLLLLVNNYIQMAGSVKKIMNFTVLIAVILWLLNTFGILNSFFKLFV